MKNLFFLAIAFIAFTLTSCDDHIKGEGMVVTQEFDLDDFNKIESQASFDVIVQQGTTQKVVVEGQQNIIDRIQLKVSNENLEMDLQNGSYRNFELTVLITVPNLEKVLLDGSGNIEIIDFEEDDLELKIKGSGNINATGQLTIVNQIKIHDDGSGNIKIEDLVADEVVAIIKGSGNIEVEDGSTKDLDITLDGSGDMKLYDLQSEDCIVVSKGSGITMVRASNDLNVTLSGSGDVKYKGNPQVDVVDNGSGDLIDAN